MEELAEQKAKAAESRQPETSESKVRANQAAGAALVPSCPPSIDDRLH